MNGILQFKSILNQETINSGDVILYEPGHKRSKTVFVVLEKQENRIVFFEFYKPYKDVEINSHNFKIVNYFSTIHRIFNNDWKKGNCKWFREGFEIIKETP